LPDRKAGASSRTPNGDLDGQEPIVFVRLAAGLDGDETGAEPRGDRRIRNRGELQVAIAVTDAGDRSDDSGSSGAESLGEVAGGFAVAGATGEGANETLFGEQANGLREIRADGTRHDDKAEAIGGANEKSVVDAEVGWPDIESAAFTMRNPIAIEPDQLFHA